MHDLVGSFSDNSAPSWILTDLTHTYTMFALRMWFLTQLGNRNKYHAEEFCGLYAILIDFIFNK